MVKVKVEYIILLFQATKIWSIMNYVVPQLRPHFKQPFKLNMTPVANKVKRKLINVWQVHVASTVYYSLNYLWIANITNLIFSSSFGPDPKTYSILSKSNWFKKICTFTGYFYFLPKLMQILGCFSYQFRYRVCTVFKQYLPTFAEII